MRLSSVNEFQFGLRDKNLFRANFSSLYFETLSAIYDPLLVPVSVFKFITAELKIEPRLTNLLKLRLAAPLGSANDLRKLLQSNMLKRKEQKLISCKKISTRDLDPTQQFFTCALMWEVFFLHKNPIKVHELSFLNRTCWKGFFCLLHMSRVFSERMDKKKKNLFVVSSLLLKENS